MESLFPIAAQNLAGHIVRPVFVHTKIDSNKIEGTVFAQSCANSEAPRVGRCAALTSRPPVSVPSLQAIITAGIIEETGAADVVLAGDVSV